MLQSLDHAKRDRLMILASRLQDLACEAAIPSRTTTRAERLIAQGERIASEIRAEFR